MREGHSYIQLVLLSNTICKKRSWWRCKLHTNIENCAMNNEKWNLFL